MKTGEWEDIAFRLLALCGGFEKYDILEDMGFSARRRRKNSQGETLRRPNAEVCLRRGSLPNNAAKRGLLISMASSPELRQSSGSLPDECRRTSSDEKLADPRTSARKMMETTHSRAMDLDMSTFDFSELRSTNLCSTEL